MQFSIYKGAIDCTEHNSAKTSVYERSVKFEALCLRENQRYIVVV
jgi:hypothetical protein